MKNLKDIFEKFIETQEGQLSLYLPIAFALGIIIYFALPFEPTLLFSFIAFFIFLGVFYYLKLKSNWALLVLFFVFFWAGFARINLQTYLVDAPFIHKKYSFVSVIGEVEKSEVYTNAQRLTLSNLYLDKIPQKDMPAKIRIRINGLKTVPQKGDTIYLKATLMPPTLPFIIDGYPFSRTAYFNKIGAIGYATGKLKIIHEAPIHSNFIEALRRDIRKKLVQALPPDEAAVAVSLITGDQNLVSSKLRESYISAGIAHILSVSGFHMTLIAGFIFLLLRSLFSLLTSFSSKINTKKICAFLALIFTFGYLLISGMAIPALRSFGMIALVLIGVIYDRKVVSLHSVFWIGFLLLLLFPEALMTASFALSFGAVIALVSSYETLYPKIKHFFIDKPKFFQYTLFPICVLFIMNFIAHFATAPIAIYHFHRYANYALLGNFLTNTLFSILIMPLLFTGVLLMPFGISSPFIWSAGYLLSLVKTIAFWISQLSYANIYIPSFSSTGYTLILLGGLLLFLIKGKIKWTGFVFIAFGFSSIFFYKLPDVIINQGGSLWAVKQPDNSFLFSSLTKAKSTRKAWLESMGYPGNIKPDKIKDLTMPININGVIIDFNGNMKADIVFNTAKTCQNKICIPRNKLWKEGTHALYIKKAGIQIKTASDKTQNRPWSQGIYLEH